MLPLLKVLAATRTAQPPNAPLRPAWHGYPARLQGKLYHVRRERFFDELESRERILPGSPHEARFPPRAATRSPFLARPSEIAVGAEALVRNRRQCGAIGENPARWGSSRRESPSVGRNRRVSGLVGRPPPHEARFSPGRLPTCAAPRASAASLRTKRRRPR